MAVDVGWVLFGILALVVLYIIITFNSLIMLRNRVNNALSQIDVQLKRRYDLIPNLVSSVKGYMKHEKGVLTEITKMRSSLISGSLSQKAKASDAVRDGLVAGRSVGRTRVYQLNARYFAADALAAYLARVAEPESPSSITGLPLHDDGVGGDPHHEDGLPIPPPAPCAREALHGRAHAQLAREPAVLALEGPLEHLVGDEGVDVALDAGHHARRPPARVDRALDDPYFDARSRMSSQGAVK
jgi:hypothetical protein